MTVTGIVSLEFPYFRYSPVEFMSDDESSNVEASNQETSNVGTSSSAQPSTPSAATAQPQVSIY